MTQRPAKKSTSTLRYRLFDCGGFAMRLASLLLPLWSLVILAPQSHGEDAAKPSFSCDKAKTLDEKTICSDARLAELDRIQAAAYLVAKRKDAGEAIKEARLR